MAKRLSWREALQALLRGECIDGNGVNDGTERYLRRCAWDRGLQLVSSGIGDYKSYFFEKPKN